FDGWLTYCGGANGGLITLDSVEVDEGMYPIIIESRYAKADTQGFGQWEGAPGMAGCYYPIGHDMTVVYAADASSFPPKGVIGGLNAMPTYSRKQLANGDVIDLPAFNEEVIKDGEKVLFF